MKKFITLMLTFILIISLTACKRDFLGNSSDINVDLWVGSFSYADVCAEYADGEPGVKTEGFNNTAVCKIETAQNAIELAKKEVNSSYNFISVAFDETEKIWGVYFGKETSGDVFIVGGDVNVYLDQNGITLRVVSGE
ncbi:MAG: hypothetical protein IKU82_00010 [Clostridia bacterium]|nr:hypothetical protein [Clostridia bacterium]